MGALPFSITTALGDNLVYSITNAAPQVFTKTVDKVYPDIGDVLTYTVTIENPNDFTVNHVLMTDATAVGTLISHEVLSTLKSADEAFTGSPMTTIHLMNAIVPGETISLTYHVLVVANPNPIANTMTATFTYTVNMLESNRVEGYSVSNTVNTVVFRNNYSQ